ncbi:GNAT family N-acetyltransferase [Salipaludibacillus sp. HK11]|uniref:GNAT family N-acetyltransferase n=1 Tax=Salipaludibacillus sp. HK11 TaxID=3394320 RepID=UPI0039FDE070
MQIVELKDRNSLFEEAIQVFWKEWGNENNYQFYEDCMIHSCSVPSEIPKFYVAIEEGEIIGTYALLRNDLNSRQDLCPWLACLFVKDKYRGRKIGSKLLQHSLREAKKKGYDKLYLSTDLDGYYEKYGWKNSGIVYGVSGEYIKLYEKETV